MNHPLEGQVITISHAADQPSGHMERVVPDAGRFELRLIDGVLQFVALSDDWPAGWNGASFTFVPGPLLEELTAEFDRDGPGGRPDGFAHYQGTVELEHATGEHPGSESHTAYIIVCSEELVTPRVVICLRPHAGTLSHGKCSHGDR